MSDGSTITTRGGMSMSSYTAMRVGVGGSGRSGPLGWAATGGTADEADSRAVPWGEI